jgi:hypothetical protein
MVILVSVLILSCLTVTGKKSIVVDTAGLTQEQIEQLEWKVKYAVAIDWQDHILKSYKATLDAMPQKEASAIHAIAWPIFKKINVAIKAMAVAITDKNTEDAQAQYQLYLNTKTEILKILAK